MHAAKDDWSPQTELALRASMRNVTGFTPFQLVYGLEAVLSIQCEISSLKLAIDILPETSEEEACFLELIQLDETRRDVALETKLIRNVSRCNLTKISNPMSSQKVTWSCFTIRTPINWEQVSSYHCGWAPPLLKGY